MAVTSGRAVSVTFAGDTFGNNTYPAATNTASPGAGHEPTPLTSGNNTITVPANATACTITKSTGNLVSVVFKGVAGDTGVKLHLTDPDSFSLDPSVTSFVLNAASSVTVFLTWS